MRLLMVQLLSKVKSSLNSRMRPLLHKGRWDSLKCTQLYKQGWWHTLTSMLPEEAERERGVEKKREKVFHQAAGRSEGVPGRCPPWGVHLGQELLELPDFAYDAVSVDCIRYDVVHLCMLVGQLQGFVHVCYWVICIGKANRHCPSRC